MLTARMNSYSGRPVDLLWSLPINSSHKIIFQLDLIDNAIILPAFDIKVPSISCLPPPTHMDFIRSTLGIDKNRRRTIDVYAPVAHGALKGFKALRRDIESRPTDTFDFQWGLAHAQPFADNIEPYVMIWMKFYIWRNERCVANTMIKIYAS